MIRFAYLLKSVFAALFGLAFAGPVLAGEVTVAVASNFLTTMQDLARDFQAETGHTVRIVNGSTGMLYAQISKGAPYDVFLSADQVRVLMLVDVGKLLNGNQKPYALGKLVLYARGKGVLAEDIRASLTNKTLRHFAMADPSTAPYGLAARQVLEHIGLESVIEEKAVLGANIGQTFGFVKTGNAEIGFVALSQAMAMGGEWLDISPDAYSPIVQGAGLLIHAKGNEAAREFYDYLSGDAAHAVLVKSGYGVPE